MAGDTMAFKCRFMEGCPMYDLITTSVRIIQLQPYLNNFCLNRENFKNCARYEMIACGQEPPADLLPNGTKLKA